MNISFITVLIFLTLSLPISFSFSAGKETLFSLGNGIFNFNKSSPRTFVQGEYKGETFFRELRPQVGAFITHQGSFYLYSGLAYDISLAQWILTPSFSSGLYFKGKGRDLGFPLEFRSALEGTFRFQEGSRMGVVIYHISNAKIRLKNPGVNGIAFIISIPLKTTTDQKMSFIPFF